jgi:hypothetical protein
LPFPGQGEEGERGQHAQIHLTGDNAFTSRLPLFISLNGEEVFTSLTVYNCDYAILGAEEVAPLCEEGRELLVVQEHGRGLTVEAEYCGAQGESPSFGLKLEGDAKITDIHRGKRAQLSPPAENLVLVLERGGARLTLKIY